MQDFKHARYPVGATVQQHQKHDRAANILIASLAIAIVGGWAGYEVGWEQRNDAAIAEAAATPTITPCPASTPDQDVIEHAWTHRGVIIHRECLIVAKPVYASPRYSAAQRPTL